MLASPMSMNSSSSVPSAVTALLTGCVLVTVLKGSELKNMDTFTVSSCAQAVRHTNFLLLCFLGWLLYNASVYLHSQQGTGAAASDERRRHESTWTFSP
jgi:hypothetical protein